MLKRISLTVSATALLFSIALAAPNTAAAQMMDGDVLISGVWALATANIMEADTVEGMSEEEAEDMDMPMEDSTAAYMTIANTTAADFTLTGAEAVMAGSVMLVDADGAAIAGGITVAAGESVLLTEGGPRIAVSDLMGMMAEGEAFAVTLMFEPADGDPFQISVGVPLLSEPPPESDIVVATAWARPTAAGMAMGDMDDGEMAEGDMPMTAPTSAIYMFIENTGSEDVALISGNTPIANILEIHETSIGDNDVMQMRPLMDGLTIPAGESVELRPGGFHVMLMDLPEPLVTGDAFYFELTFDNGDTIPLAAPVEDRLMGMMSGM